MYKYYATTNQKYKNAFTYNITTAPVNKPLTLLEVKEYLLLDTSDTSEDTFLNLLIDMATDFGQKYTGRTFINTGYTTFRDDFNDCFTLRRSKVTVVSSIEYLLNNVFTVLSTDIYGFTDVNDYSNIFLKEGQEFPTDLDQVPQAVKIVFTAGYGPDPEDVAAGLKLAMLAQIAYVYANRGDCACGNTSINDLFSQSKAFYDQYRIISIGTEDRSYPSNAVNSFGYRL